MKLMRKNFSKMTQVTNNFADTTIVAFHISGGGGNRRKVEFCGEKKIGDFVDDLFLSYVNRFEVAEKIGDRANLNALLDDALDYDYGAEARAKLVKLGLDLGECIYTDENGHDTGLSMAMLATGIGCINIDHEYNTTYTCRLSDCDENELQLILESRVCVQDDTIAYAKQQIGIEQEAE